MLLGRLPLGSMSLPGQGSMLAQEQEQELVRQLIIISRTQPVAIARCHRVWCLAMLQ